MGPLAFIDWLGDLLGCAFKLLHGNIQVHLPRNWCKTSVRPPYQKKQESSRILLWVEADKSWPVNYGDVGLGQPTVMKYESLSFAALQHEQCLELCDNSDHW
jgi:hypothetical protein